MCNFRGISLSQDLPRLETIAGSLRESRNLPFSYNIKLQLLALKSHHLFLTGLPSNPAHYYSVSGKNGMKHFHHCKNLADTVYINIIACACLKATEVLCEQGVR